MNEKDEKQLLKLIIWDGIKDVQKVFIIKFSLKYLKTSEWNEIRMKESKNFIKIKITLLVGRATWLSTKLNWKKLVLIMLF